MSVYKIQPPFPVFVDINGDHLEGGYIFVGEKDKNPQAFPIPIYWDAELTIEATQPLRTVAGQIVRNGTPASVYVGLNEYSITVLNSAQELQYTQLDVSVFQFDETTTPRTYDREFFNPGTPLASQPFAISITARDFSLLAGSADKFAKCEVAPSVGIVFDIQKNGVSIGTVDFAAAATTGVVTFVSQVDFVAGDELSIVAPGNLGGITGCRFTFAGQRG